MNDQELSLEIPMYELNHSRPIVGYGNFTKLIVNNINCQIDQSIVETKFKLWDYVIEHNLLINDGKNKEGVIVDEEKYRKHLQARLLLKDKTIYSYHNFKFDGKRFKSRWYQDVVLCDTYDRILWASSNQIGKSLMLDEDASCEFCIDHKKEWVGILVSKSLPQSQYQMRRIKQLLNSSNVKYSVEEIHDEKLNRVDNTTAISFTFYGDDEKPKYSNLLICCPPSGSALGYPVDRMWLDEYDFWENIDQDWFMKQVAEKRTIETQGTIIVISNPDGKDKGMFKLWNELDEFGNHVWHRYNFNYWDKPKSTQEQFNKLTANNTRQQIDSTMLAIFSQSAGAFLSYQEITDSISSELCQKGDSAGQGQETVWFLDIGEVHDQSVLSGGYLTDNPTYKEIPIVNVFWVHKYPVGYPLHRVFGTQPMRQIVGIDATITYVPDETLDDGWSDYVENNPSVREVLNEFSIEFMGKKEQPLFGMDVTGNSGALPLIQTIGIEPVDIGKFSGPAKWAMYQRMQYYFQQRFIKRCKDRDENTVNGKDCTYQLTKLVVKKGKGLSSSYKQVHHENEDDYDDCPDTIAGMIKLIEDPDMPTLQFKIINNSKIRNDDFQEEQENGKKNNGVITEQDKINKEMEGQYIPSFMKREQMESFVSQRTTNSGWR